MFSVNNVSEGRETAFQAPPKLQTLPALLDGGVFIGECIHGRGTYLLLVIV